MNDPRDPAFEARPGQDDAAAEPEAVPAAQPAAEPPPAGISPRAGATTGATLEPAATPEATPEPAATPEATPEPAATADVPPAASSADVPPAASSADGSGPVVVVKGVTRAFNGHLVVRGLDLTIEPGTIVGVIGPSGSGKTTTIRMLTGALKTTSGEISVLGERPTHFQRGTRERIGYMPQLFTLYADLTARENVDFVGSLFGMLWRRRRRRTREVLELLELWDARDRRASNMSGGMQRRLELACALVHEPTLLFLDEPTAGIDPILRSTIWDELHRLRDAGRTILVTTQYVGDAEDCDRVALIANGRLIAFAPPDDLRRDAFGGDVIEVETTQLFDARAIESVEGVRAVRQRTPRSFSVTVADAAVALPAVVEAVTGAGAEVVSAQEVRPTFDEVFAQLVERAEAEASAAAQAEAQAGGEQSEPAA
ncbi:MAG TPA: ATP-binding cassette domain-containing protein [Candidatus Limnocylindrales bacterium]|nr:ATP-binding cassette domain-containing protein [Candidatus Limnocylindrales bacterium]